jgi:hypothetical protein
VKNITATAGDALYQRARIAAAMRSTSLSALVRERLLGCGRQCGGIQRRV